MSRTPAPYTYNVETLSELSGWDANRIYQDVHREGINLESLGDAAVWLASNGRPEVRAEIARRVLPVVLGARRRTEENAALFDLAGRYDVMLEVFKRDREHRDRRSKKIRKVKRKRAEP